MTMRSQSGSFRLNIEENCTTDSPKAMIDAPDDLSRPASELIDKLLAFTFDVLGRQAVEQHGYEIDISLRLNGTMRTCRERRD